MLAPYLGNRDGVTHFASAGRAASWYADCAWPSLSARQFGNLYLPAAKALAAGDLVKAVTIADAGHFDLIDPQSRAFERVREAIEQP